MARSAYREQGNHSALVREAVECSGAYHCHTMQQIGGQADVRRTLHVGSSKRIQRDGQLTGCRTCECGQHVGGERERHKRAALDSKHRVAHDTKGGNVATTAPNPTRLATLTAGSTDAFAPASMVSRIVGNRR